MKEKLLNSVDDYIKGFTGETRRRLEKIRQLCHEILPESIEKMSYGMPTYKIGKEHVYFSAHQSHIGMYPLYKDEKKDTQFLKYLGKGTSNSLHFSHDLELPIEIIVQFLKMKKQKSI